MSTAAETAPSSPLPSELSDRFGPMLVKELRQGLRTKVFLTAFIGFQAILLIMVLAAFASHDSNRSATFLNAAIWSVLTLMLIVITPLRGQFALEKEIRMGTLELLQITKLDAWRIVRGKWSALMGEAMLYLTAALPYFTLRYFLGGVHILSDLALLALLAMFSAALTAVVVGLSGFRSVLLRIAVAIGVVMMLPLSIQMVEAFSSPWGPFASFRTVGFGDWWPLLVGFVVTLAVVGWSFLRLGARTIATQAENHSTGVRLVTLAGLGVVLILDRMMNGRSPGSGPLDEFPLFVFFLFATAIYTCGIFAAITDNSLQSSRIYAPFIRRRTTAIGRILLYPGWGSGYFYVMVMSAIILFVTALTEEAEAVLMTLLFIFNFLMQPAVITRILARYRRIRTFNLSTYITMMVSCAIVSSVLMIAEFSVTDGEPAITLLFPLPAVIGDVDDIQLAIGVQMFSAFIVSGLLLIAAIEDIGYTGKRERSARELIEKHKLEGRDSDPDPDAGAEIGEVERAETEATT